MANNSNNPQNSNAYWQQSPPPYPQDASTARSRVDNPSADPNPTYGPAPQSIPQYNTQQPQNPTQPQAYVSSKDHIAAGLLAILFGAFGIHKFYLGYTTAGLIMLGLTTLGSLFTFGLSGAVMALISLIEGIIYLLKNQAEFNYIYVQNYKEWF